MKLTTFQTSRVKFISWQHKPRIFPSVFCYFFPNRSVVANSSLNYSRKQIVVGSFAPRSVFAPRVVGSFARRFWTRSKRRREELGCNSISMKDIVKKTYFPKNFNKKVCTYTNGYVKSVIKTAKTS